MISVPFLYLEIKLETHSEFWLFRSENGKRFNVTCHMNEGGVVDRETSEEEADSMLDFLMQNGAEVVPADRYLSWVIEKEFNKLQQETK